MSRPPKFRPEIAGDAVVLALAGATLVRIARELGICRRTLQGWLARGRDGGEPFAAWAAAFDEAVSVARMRRLQAAEQRHKAEAKERWQKCKAARSQWWLKQLGPEEFVLRRLAWLAGRNR